VHDNFGNGLWVDINNQDALIEGNRSVGNTENGIFVEISCGGVIRNNDVEENGFDGSTQDWLVRSGILVSNSPDVQVYGNTVVNNANGIGLEHWDHGNRGAVTRCVPALKNVKVHDNTVVQKVGGASGLDAKIDRDKVWTSWGNQFYNNSYTLSDGVKFRWQSDWVSYQQCKDYGQN
jgi:parallel beta-helix repeat protein